jgi:hypothetical protein
MWAVMDGYAVLHRCLCVVVVVVVVVDVGVCVP